MEEAVKFQHFEILRREDASLYELGRGAMGVTYKAYDTNLRCHVALKVINDSYLNNDIARQRFLREARAAAALRHPNVATVFHLGQEDGSYFYAMEFVDGETLESYMKTRGPIPTRMALEIADQVARALGAAQKQGLVHRDIKPSNLMLIHEDENEFTVKVIDFGLAKNAKPENGEETATLTMGGFLGTPHFASPEQLDEREVDVRSDIYSLGVTLWYMLSGRTPFAGSMAQVMSQHLNRPPPLETLKDQPPEILRLLDHLLQKDPAFRPQTPADLRKELEVCIDSLKSQVGNKAETAISSPATESFVTAVMENPTSPSPPIKTQVVHQTAPKAFPNFFLISVIVLAAAIGAGAFIYWKLHSTVVPTSSPAVAVTQSTPTPAAPSASPIPSVAPQRNHYDELLAQAAAKETAGDDIAALELYAKIAIEFPNESEPKLQMEMIAAKLRTAGTPLSPKLQTALESAARENVISAQMILGESFRKENPEQALKWLLSAANKGNTEAMVKAGLMYSNGKGTANNQPDMASTVHWFRRAREAGDETGALLLADCYLDKEGKKGVPYDPKYAAELLTEGWAKSDPLAMNKLGGLYRAGEGVSKDYNTAFALYEAAMQMGFLDAQGNLGVLYAYGEGVPKPDIQKAVELFRDGARKNNPFCIYLYAQSQMAKNPVEAREWMIKAAKLKNPHARDWCAKQGIDFSAFSP